MVILEVVESKVWVHAVTGRRVSPYGATPWTSEADKANWTLQAVGFTWRNDNGTVGLGRVPAATREEAETVMREHNTRVGVSVELDGFRVFVKGDSATWERRTIKRGKLVWVASGAFKWDATRGFWGGLPYGIIPRMTAEIERRVRALLCLPQ